MPRLLSTDIQAPVASEASAFAPLSASAPQNDTLRRSGNQMHFSATTHRCEAAARHDCWSVRYPQPMQTAITLGRFPPNSRRMSPPSYLCSSFRLLGQPPTQGTSAPSAFSVQPYPFRAFEMPTNLQTTDQSLPILIVQSLRQALLDPQASENHASNAPSKFVVNSSRKRGQGKGVILY